MRFVGVQGFSLPLHQSSPPLQRIRTALRTSGGRFFYEGEGIESRDGAVEGAADVGGDELEADGAEEAAQGLR